MGYKYWIRFYLISKVIFIELYVASILRLLFSFKLVFLCILMLILV